MAITPMFGGIGGFGLAIESSFRQAPITQQGSTTVYNIGITNTNPLRYMTIEPGGGIDAKPEMMVADGEIDGSGELTRTIRTGNDYSGAIGFKFDPEAAYYPLLGIFGTDVQTLIAGGGTTGLTAAYQHDFTYGKFAPSFTIEEIIGNGNYGKLHSGFVFQTLDFDIGDPVICKFNGMAFRSIPNTYPYNGTDTKYTYGSTASLLPVQMGGDGTKQVIRTATPTYVDVAQGNTGTGPHVFGKMVGGTIAGFGNVNGNPAILAIDDVAYDPLQVQILKGCTHNLGRKIDASQIASSGLDKGAVVGGAFTVTGKIGIYFTDHTVYQGVMNNSKFALNYAIPGVAIGNSGQVYNLEVHIPHMKLQDVPVQHADGPVLISSNYVARKDPYYGYAIKIRLVNTLNNATLGGAAGTTGAAGGLGGWNYRTQDSATLR